MSSRAPASPITLPPAGVVAQAAFDTKWGHTPHLLHESHWSMKVVIRDRQMIADELERANAEFHEEIEEEFRTCGHGTCILWRAIIAALRASAVDPVEGV